MMINEWIMSFFYAMGFLCLLGFLVLFISSALEQPIAFFISIALIVVPTVIFKFALF